MSSPTESDIGENAARVMGLVFEFVAEGRDCEGMRRRSRAVLRVLRRGGQDAEDADSTPLEKAFRRRLKDCL